MSLVFIFIEKSQLGLFLFMCIKLVPILKNLIQWGTL